MAQVILLMRTMLGRLNTRPRLRNGAAALALVIGAAVAIELWGDPTRAYASARIELPHELHVAALADEHPTPVAPGHGDDHAGGALDPRAAIPTHAPSHAAAAEGGLALAPIGSLTRQGPGGLLPRIGDDGLTPALGYARPFHDAGDDRPLIAVAIGGLGLNAKVTEAAIDTLPGEVTLAFSPYADDLQGWIDAARAAGHEAVLELPMEPYDYPANDPGPHTLLARADWVENQRRLDWLMSRATGYFAVTNDLGARFTSEPEALDSVFAALAEAGVAFVYDGDTRRAELRQEAAGAGLDLAVADRVLDEEPDSAAIDDQLLHLEALAIQNGDALGAGFGYPVTVRQVEAWADTLRLKGYRLAPVSAVLARRAAANRRQLAAAEAAPAAGRPSFSRVAASFGEGRDEAGEGGGHGEGSSGGGHH